MSRRDMNESILIVDDSQLNRRLLGRILRKEDYRISESASGHDAVRTACEEKPDLILLDLMMPKIDGFEVLRRLKSTADTSDIPVILVSALDDAANKIKGLDLGADDYITKPFDRGETLARVRAQLRIRQLNKDIVEKQIQIDQDLAAAAEIQRSLMPNGFDAIDHLETASHFEPSEIIGGDIYNVVRIDDDHIGFFVVDVSGHGVPAAMITVAVAQSLSLTAGIVVDLGSGGAHYVIRRPEEVFTELEKLFPFERFHRHFTIIYLVLELSSGLLQYGCAGHPPPILQRKDGSVTILEGGGPVIGLGDIVPHEEREIELASGDRVYLYTDGIVEHKNAEKRAFGVEGLLRAITDSESSPLEEVCARAMYDVERHGDSSRFQDDVSLLAFELLARTHPSTARREESFRDVRRSRQTILQ